MLRVMEELNIDDMTKDAVLEEKPKSKKLFWLIIILIFILIVGALVGWFKNSIDSLAPGDGSGDGFDREVGDDGVEKINENTPVSQEVDDPMYRLVRFFANQANINNNVLVLAGSFQGEDLPPHLESVNSVSVTVDESTSLTGYVQGESGDSTLEELTSLVNGLANGRTTDLEIFADFYYAMNKDYDQINRSTPVANMIFYRAVVSTNSDAI